MSYHICGLEIVSDELGEDETHLDCGLSEGGYTILVRTEISAMNHYGQLRLPQNSNRINIHQISLSNLKHQ